MFGLFNRGTKEDKEIAQRLYQAVIAQAGNPKFYKDFGVPESVEGRFELVTIHAYMMMRRLKTEKSGKAVNQILFDIMFKDIELALREMGVGDLTVPKQMKKMMNGFNGRIQSYEKGLAEGGQVLLDTVRRNIFGTLENVPEDKVKKMTDYILAVDQKLASIDTKNILSSQQLYDNI